MGEDGDGRADDHNGHAHCPLSERAYDLDPYGVGDDNAMNF